MFKLSLECVFLDLKGPLVPKEYLQVNISDLRSVPLSMLLPSWKGQGICSIALVFCLTNIQNEFLDVYVKECKQK